MKTAVIAMVVLLMLAGGICAQKVPSFSPRNDGIFTGEIIDSLCAEDRHHIGVIKTEKNTSKAGCTLSCVKWGGAQFVLYNSDSKHIYQLNNQQQPEPYAGQEVTVIGGYDKDTNAIHVISIRPKITYAGLSGSTSSHMPRLLW
jgi:hypothetical protein